MICLWSQRSSTEEGNRWLFRDQKMARDNLALGLQHLKLSTIIDILISYLISVAESLLKDALYFWELLFTKAEHSVIPPTHLPFKLNDYILYGIIVACFLWPKMDSVLLTANCSYILKEEHDLLTLSILANGNCLYMLSLYLLVTDNCLYIQQEGNASWTALLSILGH